MPNYAHHLPDLPRGQFQYTDAPAEISISGTSARNSSDLANGWHTIRADIACYFLQGGSSVTATSSSHELAAGELRRIWVDGSANARIAVISKSGASGTLQIKSDDEE